MSLVRTDRNGTWCLRLATGCRGQFPTLQWLTFAVAVASSCAAPEPARSICGGDGEVLRYCVGEKGEVLLLLLLPPPPPPPLEAISRGARPRGRSSCRNDSSCGLGFGCIVRLLRGTGERVSGSRRCPAV